MQAFGVVIVDDRLLGARQGFADAGAVLVEGLVLFGGEETDLAREAVTIGVETSAMLAFFGFGTGGVLSVGDVCGLCSTPA